MVSTAADSLLRVTNLSKSFPGVQALSAIHLEVERGSVQAIMGENGAGKSTLMKILAGHILPDEGEILFKGCPVRFRSPHHALRQGVAMIPQELLPFPNLTVTENVFMGRELTLAGTGWLKKRLMQREARVLLERLGAGISPHAKMNELRVAEMQMVEIAKALIHRAELIIMDEPTSAISGSEVHALFEIVRDLKRQGVAVLYISHRMEEVFDIADRVTVLRDGKQVASLAVGKSSPSELIRLMVGRDLTPAPIPAAVKGEVVLRVRGLGRAGRFQDVNFEVCRGEILGIAGLVGAGRTDLANAIYGLVPAERGAIEVQRRLRRIRNPRDAIACGMAMVSEDRKEFGLVTTMSLKHNLTLSGRGRGCRNFWIDRRVENRIADDRIRAFSIRTRDRDQRVSLLSGGNQQKVVIAKALLSDPEVLILDEPTRGVDVGAREEIYAIIRDLARAGMAVIMISSELPELFALSTRLLVMSGGRITADLDPRKTTQESIMKFALGGRQHGRSNAPTGE